MLVSKGISRLSKSRLVMGLLNLIRVCSLPVSSIMVGSPRDHLKSSLIGFVDPLLMKNVESV